MAGETITPPAGQPVTQAAPPITPPDGTPPAAGTTPPPSGEPSKTVVMPQSALARIKQEQRQKGQRDALVALAEQLGYESVDEMKAHLAKGRGGGGGGGRNQPRNGQRNAQPPAGASAAPAGEPPVPPVPPQRGAGQEEWRKYARQREQFERDRSAYKQRIARADNKVRELQKRLDAQTAEMELREIAAGVGVKDLDYAIRLCTRHLEGKSEEDLKSFDERKFFEGLRATNPYLFGETTVPANTGTAGAPPPPPRPGTTAQVQANAGQFDARSEKLTRKEVNDKLRTLGLDPLGL